MIYIFTVKVLNTVSGENLELLSYSIETNKLEDITLQRLEMQRACHNSNLNKLSLKVNNKLAKCVWKKRKTTLAIEWFSFPYKIQRWEVTKTIRYVAENKTKYLKSKSLSTFYHYFSDIFTFKKQSFSGELFTSSK